MNLGFGDPWRESTCGPIFYQEFGEGATKVELKWFQCRSKLRSDLREATPAPSAAKGCGEYLQGSHISLKRGTEGG